MFVLRRIIVVRLRFKLNILYTQVMRNERQTGMAKRIRAFTLIFV
jgi:hypothetical protein